MKNKNDYNADSIQIYEGIEAVRKRPSMYLGSTYEEGFNHLVWEIIDNALDEYLAGFGKTIKVTLSEDNIVSVEDEGRGIPTGIHPKTKLSTLETIFTYLHAGGKFDRQTYMVSGGLHGVGSTVVNAMSEFLEVSVYKNKEIHSLKFNNGKKTTENIQITPNYTKKRKGTVVKFKPNIDLFDDYYQFKKNIIEERLQQTAYINSGIKIIFKDERVNYEKTFFYENGIHAFLNKIIGGEKNLINQHKEIIEGKGQSEGVRLSFAFRYSVVSKINILSFCNNIATIEGGTHQKGFQSALTRVIKKLMLKEKYYDDNKEKIESEDILKGVHAILVVLHPEPRFAGQTKGKLVNTELVSLVSKLVAGNLERFLIENPLEKEKIFKKVFQQMRLRVEIENKVKEFKVKTSLFENSTLPGKLSDCASKDIEKNEIFIVEGDSAGGSAKLGRDRNIQAILPLKGKIVNSVKTSINKLFENQEISDLITSLGLNLNNRELECEMHGQSFCNECQMRMIQAKLRYGKVIIMTDADVDGAHISVLLLTFFYRFIPGLFSDNRVFLAQPPLFKFKVGKKATYLYDEESLNKHIIKTGTNKYEIQRYKGLGEMNPAQLWETTMDPQKRILKLVKVEDAENADKIIQLLMGKEVEGRKRFLFANALKAKNLDI